MHMPDSLMDHEKVLYLKHTARLCAAAIRQAISKAVVSYYQKCGCLRSVPLSARQSQSQPCDVIIVRKAAASHCAAFLRVQSWMSRASSRSRMRY